MSEMLGGSWFAISMEVINKILSFFRSASTEYDDSDRYQERVEVYRIKHVNLDR